MPPQFSPYALLSQMRLSNYMSSPSFDRGMEQGPPGGGGFMSTPFMPSPQDVAKVQGGGMPNFQPMPNDNPLGQFKGFQDGHMQNSGLFGGHPLLQHVLGNALGFMGNFQQGETTGENIGNVARGLLGMQAFPRQAAMGRFEGAFGVANQLDQLKQRQAMSDYYSGRGDYYQMKNEYEQKFHDQADQTKRSIDEANNQTKTAIAQMQDQQRTQHEQDWAAIQSRDAAIKELRARNAGVTAGESMTKMQSKMITAAAKDPDSKTPEGKYAHNWLQTMAQSAGNVAGSKAEATANAQGKDQFDRRADAHFKSQMLDAKDFRTRQSIQRQMLLSTGKIPSSGELDAEFNKQNNFVSSAYQEWKKAFNPKDPYEFSAYLADKRKATDQGASSPIPGGSQPQVRTYNPNTKQIE